MNHQLLANNNLDKEILVMRKVMHILLTLCCILLPITITSCYPSINLVPKSSFGVIYSSRNCDTLQLKRLADNAIKLNSCHKIVGVIIAVPDDNKEYLNSLLKDTNLEEMTALSVEPIGIKKTMKSIRNVMGYRCSFVIIRNKRFYRRTPILGFKD